MRKIAAVCFLLCSTSYADDVYLQTGFVMRNVQVIDTVNGVVTIKRDGEELAVSAEHIVRIEQGELLPGQKSVYELFSGDLYEKYQQSAPERERLATERRRECEAARMASMADSIEKARVERERLYPWGGSLYFAGGWGTPQGFRGELGYNFGTMFSLGVAFGIGDKWSRDPDDGTFGFLGSIRFPINSTAIAPYLLVVTGGTYSLVGNSDGYTLIYLGAIVPLRPWLQLRPELGFDFTSKHVSGGRSLLGGSSPRVTEDNTRFGAHITMEIDFRQVF